MYVACEGLSDLGNGPNQPTATIIGEHSASYHHGALLFTLEDARLGLNRDIYLYLPIYSDMNSRYTLCYDMNLRYPIYIDINLKLQR